MVRETSKKKSKNQPKKDVLRDDVEKENYIFSSLRALGALKLLAKNCIDCARGLLPMLCTLWPNTSEDGQKRRHADAIQQARDIGTGSNPSRSMGVQSSHIRAKNATARLNNAKNDMQAVQRLLDSRISSISEAQGEADKLQASLNRKRLTSLLLQALERKETIRSARITKIRNLTEELEEQTSVVRKSKQHEAISTVSKPRSLSNPYICVDHTHDTLASLRAYHIRISRLSASTTTRHSNTQVQTSEARLRKAVAHAMNLNEDDEGAMTAYEECKQFARRRAEQALHYRSPILDQSGVVPRERDFNEIHRTIIEKEQALQSLSDSSIALELSNKRSLQSQFTDDTVPALFKALQEETAATDGHIDVLRLSVMKRETVAAEQLNQNHKISHRKAFAKKLSEIRRVIEQAHEQEMLIRNAILLDAQATRDSEKEIMIEELIAMHHGRQTKADEQSAKLLRRKLEKARAGDILQRDIERMIAEVGIVGALSGRAQQAHPAGSNDR